jgi:hypothetical protein
MSQGKAKKAKGFLITKNSTYAAMVMITIKFPTIRISSSAFSDVCHCES